MTAFQMKLAAAGIGAFLIFALYRRIADIAKIMLGLWIVMLVTTGWVILSGIWNCNGSAVGGHYTHKDQWRKLRG